ncbi:uncharacterized protein LOC123322156 [Coccinella septempunctata]|uniref:uncharacterized protein LOC123322156 n=1 Tax=Coccinella septempunctata TaxID=41139 RepID=UPI001D05CC9F|nr:uncharacterized protein LOC123322156 [Coccinella septempunctata]
MEQKMLYTFRGWIAFVAFMDLGTAIRSYIEKKSFLDKTSENEYSDGEFTTSRLLGLFSVLKALVLIHCTLFIHYKPIVSIGICSLFVTIILYLSETIYFRAATLSFYVIFPCVLNIITLAGLVYFPIKLKLWSSEDIGEDTCSLFKQSVMARKRRNMRKNI